MCAACNGADGNNSSPAVPKLAGLQRAYIVKQLNDYRAGKRHSVIMGPVVAGLSDEDIESLAVYYNQQRSLPSPAATDRSLAEAGKRIFLDGKPGTGVPSCSGCHHADGSGTGRTPRLAGQNAEYMAQQMRNFATGKRENDRGQTMQSVATRMTEHEIRAVADYIAGLE